jgi:hypothetical protein
MERTTRRFRCAQTILLALSAGFPTGLSGQEAAQPPVAAAPKTTAPAKPAVPPRPPTVYSNPRAEASDPRIGLKGGLHDAGEAASGIQRIATRRRLSLRRSSRERPVTPHRAGRRFSTAPRIRILHLEEIISSLGITTESTSTISTIRPRQSSGLPFSVPVDRAMFRCIAIFCSCRQRP